ncbi:DUF3426 domain-containing protein [Viridibacterium curvum]|uniref:Zinc finger/thioredoxin putative domain-containing protein n=1 Tax=Viridibacterium curvum TaxID=1101404 RepID=A0ABP9R7J0_9RHOO
MLITRCPHCQTSFRIRPEQLNLRGGRVRCGHCQTPFSALSSLDEMPEESAAARIAPPANATPAGATQAVAQAAPASPAPQAGDGDNMGDFDIQLDLEEEAREVAGGSATHGAPAATPASPAPAVEQISLGNMIDDLEDEIAAEGGALPDQHDPALADALESGTEEDAAPEGESVPQLHTVFLDEELPHHIKPDAAELAARRSRRNRLIAANVALALSGILLATYVLRAQLASQYPGLREPLEQACATLGCDVPYLRDAELVKLEGSELVPSKERRDGYQLAFTLRNEARYPVAWPQLEIILTDRYERWLTRRILEPSEWLPADMGRAPAFEAHGELTTRLDLASDVEAVGYKVGVFYR